jgi:hypothetical protein
MTQEDIEQWTREAGCFDATPEFLERFATLVWKDGFNRGFKSGHDWADKMRETKQEYVRPWKGLTDKEQLELYKEHCMDGWGLFYDAIQAKLKEKNHASP